MDSARDDTALPVPGFHSGIRGSKPVQQLTAAYRSRPRPSSTPVPRHPPHALTILRSPARSRPGGYRLLANCAVFKVREGATGARPGWSLKTQQYAASLCGRAFPQVGRHARNASGHDSRLTPARAEAAERRSPEHVELPRKEVIQPHLPVRLPCYDFSPHEPHLRRLPPEGWVTGFGCCPLSWCDGRCVQGPGTYSPRRC